MPDGIAGDQSPPDDDRIRPTFRDILAFVEYVVRVGTRACKPATRAPWLLEMSLVDERASSRKRTSKTPGEIEQKDLEIGAFSLLRDVAAAALPEFPDEGPIAIGEHTGYVRTSLARRSQGAALARGNCNGKYWRETRQSVVVEAIAEELYRLIYPEPAVGTTPGEGGSSQ